MEIKQLIEAAVKRTGKKQGEFAKELGIQPARISDWKNGKWKPNASEIAYFAEQAGLPVLETLAEIEEQSDPRFAQIWERALGNLRAVTMAANSSSSTTTQDQTIRTLITTFVDSLGNTPDQVQIKAMLLAVLNAFPAEQPTIATVPQIRGTNARGVAVEKPRLRKSLRT